MTGKDGKLLCPKCKKCFGRLRHFNTHKCLAAGDYGILSDDDYEDDEEYDQTPDYKPVRREIELVEADEKEESSTQNEVKRRRISQKNAAKKLVKIVLFIIIRLFWRAPSLQSGD